MTTKANKPKEKPVPINCICGATPVDVKARGLGVCCFCNECCVRGSWQKNRDTAIENWNTEVYQMRYSGGIRRTDNA